MKKQLFLIAAIILTAVSFAQPPAETIFGVARNTAGTWSVISDASHQPSIGVTVSNATAPFNFRINFPVTYSKVGSCNVDLDEAYAKYGLSIGASVGLSYADVAIYGEGISGYIYYNVGTSSWVVVYSGNSLLSGSDITCSFSAGVLTVTHTPATMVNNDLGINAQARESNYICEQGGAGTSTFTVRFKDYAGNVITTPDAQMKLFFTRTGRWNIANSKLPVSFSNIWFDVTMWP